MSHLPYFDYESFGTRTKKEFNSSQAVRLANTIEISGQGGWDPHTEAFPPAVGDEIDQAFSNVELALKTAGGKGWEGVYKIRMYIALRGEGNEAWEDEYGQHIVRNLKKWCPNHGPILTLVEVKRLFKDMRIEIEATEHVE